MKRSAKPLVLIGLLLVLLSAMIAGGTVAAAEAEVEQRANFSTPVLVVNTSFLNVRMGPGVQYDVLVTVVGGTQLPVLGVARDLVWYQVSTAAGVGWVNFEYTIPRGQFGNVPFAEAPPASQMTGALTGADDAISGFGFTSGRAWGVSVVVAHPARTGPTMNSGSPGDALVDLSRIYAIQEAVTAEGGVVWYRLNVPVFGSVWVEATKTKMRPFACELSAVQFRTSLAPVLGPDGSGSIDGEMRYPEGTEAYLLDHVGNQFKVEMSDGNVGWIPQEAALVRGDVFSDYCEAGGRDAVSDADTDQTSQPSRAAARVVINTAFLNVRSGPGAQYTVVSTLPGGTELAVVGFAPDDVWYLVEGAFGRGWLNSEFVLFRGDGSAVPVVRDAVGVMARPMAQISNAVVLYAAPNTTMGQIGALSGPLEVPIVGRTTILDWVQVNTSLGFGWLRADQISISGDTSMVPVVGG